MHPLGGASITRHSGCSHIFDVVFIEMIYRQGFIKRIKTTKEYILYFNSVNIFLNLLVLIHVMYIKYNNLKMCVIIIF